MTTTEHTIALMSSAFISISYISIITKSWYAIKSNSISSNLCSDDVIRSVPDFILNSNWPIWKSFYSFLSRLLENPTSLIVKSCIKSRNWMDLNWRIYNFKRYLNRNIKRWSRCSSWIHRCCYRIKASSNYFIIICSRLRIKICPLTCLNVLKLRIMENQTLDQNFWLVLTFKFRAQIFFILFNCLH